MASNPCPCMSLQRGSMTLAIIDAVISMINLGLMILALVYLIQNNEPDLTESERKVGIIVAIILAIVCVLQVLLAFRLYYGAKNRDYRNCKMWIIVTTIVTIINIINIILNFTASDFHGDTYGGTVFGIVYKIYEISVVYFFIRELKLEALGIGYTVTSFPQPQPQPMPIYATPQSYEAYPMQQYTTYPTLTNPSYPAPVHHVTTTVIS